MTATIIPVPTDEWLQENATYPQAAAAFPCSLFWEYTRKHADDCASHAGEVELGDKGTTPLVAITVLMNYPEDASELERMVAFMMPLAEARRLALHVLTLHGGTIVEPADLNRVDL